MSKTNQNVVLHLGAHKTGTSLIQKFLRDRPEEARRLGFGVISRSAGNKLFGWGEHTLPAASTTRECVDKMFADKARHVIVSHENALGHPLEERHEHLYPDAADCASNLAEVFSPYSVTAIFYIRSQEAFLESYYLQTVHQGSTLSFRDWLQSVDTGRVSWTPLANALTSAFGPAAVKMADFNEIRNGQEDFLRRFIARVDPALRPNIEYAARRNASVGDLGLELALALNPFLETTAERRATRKYLQASFSNTRYPRPVLFSDTESKEIQDAYAAENEQLLAIGELP